MTEYNYPSMLNLAYEIEGLIALLGQRDDQPDGAIRLLAVDKVDSLRAMLSGSAVAASSSSVPGETSASLTPSGADRELEEIESMPEAEPSAAAPVSSRAAAAPVSATSAAPASEPPAAAAPPRKEESAAPRRPLQFTLNDKFRFRRELFANNDIEFTDAVNVLSGMGNLTEAEDYLYNDLCWDSSNEDVQAFMAILADYFTS